MIPIGKCDKKKLNPHSCSLQVCIQIALHWWNTIPLCVYVVDGSFLQQKILHSREVGFHRCKTNFYFYALPSYTYILWCIYKHIVMFWISSLVIRTKQLLQFFRHLNEVFICTNWIFRPTIACSIDWSVYLF